MLLFWATNIYAADHYIAQSAAGLGNGDSCANATAISYYTGSWSGKVSAGDTVHLCGTLTSTLIIGASGSSGNPITVKFESGAKFSSSTAWGQDASSAIYASSKSYITIDGASTGIIENTDNGDALGHQDVTTYGIALLGCLNVTVKDLTIRNMYVHVSGGATSHTFVQAINIVGGSNITTSGNTISHSGVGIWIASNSGTFSTATISGNIVSYCNKCFVVALGEDTASIDGVDVNGNTCRLTPNWYEAGNLNHGAAIHLWGRDNYGTQELTNIKI